MADKHSVEAFQIGEHDELLQRGVVAEVALGSGMRIAPLLRGLAEEGNIEEVRFVGVDEARLLFVHAGRDESLLDLIGMDAVIDLGEDALEVSVKLKAVVFVVLEALEFLDKVGPK